VAKGSSPSGDAARLACIDTLRALAIAAVVLFHADAPLAVAVPVLSASGGLLGVQLFFLVSGYLVSASARRHSLRTYAIRRVLRIYPVHVPVMQWVHGPLGLDGPASLLVALVLAVAVAWALPLLVEEPGIRLGRRLTPPDQ
jgi:peptidoglycan/LPS O-acetylase OafA/YrhL